MNSLAIFGIIVVVMIMVVFSLKYALTDKTSVTDVLDASKATEIEIKQNKSSNDFTFSVWVFVKEWSTGYDKFKPIFWVDQDKGTKGGDHNDILKILNINPCTDTSCDSDSYPKSTITAAFDRTENNVLFAMRYATDTLPRPSGNKTTKIFKCQLSNVPIQKWVHLTFVLNNKTLDLYMNGKLSKTCILPGVPTLDTPTFVNLHGKGDHFNGFTSKFQHFPNALNTQEVWNLYSNGYGNLGSSISDYKLQFSLIENGSVINTLTM